MKQLRAVLSLVALSALATFAAQGQATRTWVSGVGDDANPCSRTAPCKTFAGAISKTSTGGEIDALDPGGFGSVTITKSITIDGAAAGLAGVLVSGTNGITVNASGATVTLRNLTFDGLGTGLSGIGYIAGASLNIEHCVIYGFLNNGITIAPTAVTSSQIFITDTISRNNAGDGLNITSAGAYSYVQVSGSQFNNNVNGIHSADYSRTTVVSSEVAGNSNAGFLAQAAAGSAYISVDASTITHNVVGVEAGGTPKVGEVRLSNTFIVGNTTGISVLTTGTVASWGNNHDTDPGTPSTTLTPL